MRKRENKQKERRRRERGREKEKTPQNERDSVSIFNIQVKNMHWNILAIFMRLYLIVDYNQ